MAGSAGVAQAEVRALNLINSHTQERATVVFKRDGVYDQNGLQELNRLLRDWRRNEVTRMDPQLFDLIWEVYRKTGAHEPIHIVCGYRSPATNNMLRSRSRGVAKFSQHMLGKAMDFYLPDVQLSTLRETGMKMQMGGVGFYPSSGSPFVHMDTGSVRAWPRMTREQLVRLFPDGKTAHLPSDGEPLSGYNQAVADADARKAKGGGPVSSSGGGLLASIFGLGDSPSPSGSRQRVAVADDEEEGAAPAPAPRSRTQELKQGPLPPGSNPKIMARDETPPGNAPAAVDLPSATPKPRPAQQQQLALVAEPEPQIPPPPVPTTRAQGSLVSMPVAGSQPPLARGAAPAQPQATAEAHPSRYGPQGNDLPPGWVVGPSGQPGSSAAAAPVQAPAPQQVALAPELKPISAPLPMPDPRLALVSGASGRPLATGELGTQAPRPRPTGPMRSAAAEETGVGAHAAIAALTGEAEPGSPMLGYAARPTEAPAATQPAPRDAPIASNIPAASGPAVAPSRSEARTASLAPMLPAAVASDRGKSDRAGVAASVSKPIAPKGDRSAAAHVLDNHAKTSSESFALLRHPDQLALDGLLAKPNLVLAAGFGRSLTGTATGGFSGPAVVALPIIRIQ